MMKKGSELFKTLRGNNKDVNSVESADVLNLQDRYFFNTHSESRVRFAIIPALLF
jgi:hypothetical protein